MAKAIFGYVIYIAATPGAVWKALLDGEFTRQYWGGDNISDWRPGSTWEHRRSDATRSVAMIGEVLEAVAPQRLALTWADPEDRGNKARYSRVTFEIETVGQMARLTVTHDQLEAGSDMQGKISQGWPRVLSSLKSLLETGRALSFAPCG
jgi:uncharacterized protein YndB with AHSA1/START domain